MKTKTFFFAVIFLIISNVMGQLTIQGFYMEYEKTISVIVDYKGYEDNIFVMESIGNTWKTIDTIPTTMHSYVIKNPVMNAQYKCTTNSEESNNIYFTTVQTFYCSMIEKRDPRTKMSETHLYVQLEKKNYAGALPKETFNISMNQHIIKYNLFDGKGNLIVSEDNEKELLESMAEIESTASFEEKIQKVQELNKFLQKLKTMEFTTDFLSNGNYMLDVYTDEGPFEPQKKSTTFTIQR